MEIEAEEELILCYAQRAEYEENYPICGRRKNTLYVDEENYPICGRRKITLYVDEENYPKVERRKNSLNVEEEKKNH